MNTRGVIVHVLLSVLQVKEGELASCEELRADLRLQVREEAIKNMRLDKVT